MDSEFRTYGYINKVLDDLGWDTRSPERGGDVYTQREFNSHDDILTKTLKRKTPENIIRIPADGGFKYWVVEAKASHSDIEKGLDEAKDYALQINQFDSRTACFATGIAGSPDNSFLVTTCYWDGHQWHEVSINDYKTTGFLSKEQCLEIINKNSPNIEAFDTDPDRFLKKANAINSTLHENGVAVGDRAKFMGALLLALADDTPLRIFNDAKRQLDEVNTNIEKILRDHGKEEFIQSIRLTEPATKKNYPALLKSIVETIQHLREMNVRSAINSSDDSLGKFYETFLKYANGAKEMGIVLTPRHITQFACDVVGVSPNDRVFDPTCGTGGFLVSAMDAIRRKYGMGRIYNDFKKSGIFGVEKEDPVYGLALVNMIFRGDGKSGLFDGNCFDHEFWEKKGKVCWQHPKKAHPEGCQRPFSRIFMNPPFKIKKYPEVDFVDYAIRQMKPGGLLFAVLPAVSIGGKKFLNWRKQLLHRHSVKAIIKFDKNLFYPVQEGTYGLIIEAHIPHIIKDKVFMGILFDDEHRPRISKMLSRHGKRDNQDRITSDLQNFLIGKSVSNEDIPEEQILKEINIDRNCTFAPEAYINSTPTQTIEGINKRGTNLLNALISVKCEQVETTTNILDVEEFPLQDLIVKVVKSPCKNLKDYEQGSIPVITATEKNNGIEGYRNIPDNLILNGLISISKTHNTKPCQAFWHPYNFSAINTVHLIKPVEAFTNDISCVLYLCQAITKANAWRYDYARPVNLDELTVFLPSRDRVIQYDIIKLEAQRLFKSMFYNEKYLISPSILKEMGISKD